MRFSVQQLLNDRPPPITVSLADTMDTAIDLMREYDYSQIPVIDEQGKPIGLVFSDGIVQAVHHFHVKPQILRISDVMQKPMITRDDQELFDLLDTVQAKGSVLIVNNQGVLTGIVTSYDTTEYFRRQTQDLMYVQDIEFRLRDFILSFLLQANPALEGVSDTPTVVITRPQSQQADFIKAVKSLITDPQAPKISDRRILQAFETYFEQASDPQPIDQLTLAEIIQLFLSKDYWRYYGHVFSVKPDDIRAIFDIIRKTRNDLAHLREITNYQRERLRFCKDWLARHQPPQIDPISSALIDAAAPVTAVDTVVPVIVESPQTPAEFEDAPLPNASRYDRLAHKLRSEPLRIDRLQLSFTQIEDILALPLPPSARTHRSWWANDTNGHAHSKSWLAADWKVSYINMDQELVTFSRIHEREQAYIDFFSRFVAELRARDNRFLSMSPNGTSWITVARMKTQQRSFADFNVQFTRTGFFRLELYIDTRNEALNTAIYEALWQLYRPKMATLTAQIGTAPEWDAMPGRRAARVTVSHPGAITATNEELAEIRQWGIETMVVFHQLFADAGQLLEQHYTTGAAPDLAALFS